MNHQKFITKSCCGKTALIYKIDRSINKELIDRFVAFGFIEKSNFTVAGICYVENDNFVLTGTIGSDKLQVKCRKKTCETEIINLESLFNLC
jgi:hypothetical protein